jgi:hypothetical protein
MGHAIHFLERIERLNLGQADRALALYRDAEAVRFLLGKLGLPPQAERVALAFAPGEAPPHLILTREGRFVTCLASGMVVPDLPVVAYDRMERVLGQFESLRDLLDGKVSQGAALEKLRLLFNRAEEVSREQFEELLPIRALLSFSLLHLVTGFGNDCDLFRNTYRPGALRDVSRENHALAQYWRAMWAANHLTLLMVQDVPDLERLVEQFFAVPGSGKPEQRKGDPRDLPDLSEITVAKVYFQLTWMAIRSGLTGMMLRGLYIAGRLGRLCLGAVRADLLRVGSIFTTTHNMGCLGAVSLRHARLREEAEKLMDKVLRYTEEQAAARPELRPGDHTGLSKAIAASLRAVPRDPKRMDDHYLLISREKLWEMMEPATRDPRFAASGISGPEDLPEHVARSVVSTFSYDYQDLKAFGSGLTIVASGLPWAAGAEVTELFMPEGWLAPFREPNNRVDPGRVRSHLASLGIGPAPRVPVRVEKKPGRNDPCSCGSGRKYKVCCGGGG